MLHIDLSELTASMEVSVKTGRRTEWLGGRGVGVGVE